MRIIFKGGDRIRKAYKSIFIKKNFMPAADNALLSQDIETYNRMMHTAFVWNNQDRVFPDDHSIHLHLKDQYHCNDYFANSANQEAKGKLRSLKELRSSYISDMKDDIRAITKKITGKQKYLVLCRQRWIRSSFIRKEITVIPLRSSPVPVLHFVRTVL